MRNTVIGLATAAAIVTAGSTLSASAQQHDGYGDHSVADLDRRLSRIEAAIEEAAKRARTNAALAAIERQKKVREALAAQRHREGIGLAAHYGLATHHDSYGQRYSSSGGQY